MKRSFILTAALLVMPISASYADEITVSGCAAAGVEANCIVLETGGKTYNITSAQPPPVPGTFGTIMGTLSDKMSSCQQGEVIDPATWTVDAGKQCPVETSQ